MAVIFKHSTKSHTQQSCPPIEQLPNAIFYPFRFFQQPKHAHFLKDFERNRNYYRDTSWIYIGDNDGFSIYFHIHKVGGTTMSNSFGNHPNVEIYYFLRRRTMGGVEKFISVYRYLLERLADATADRCIVLLHSRPGVAVPQLCGRNAGPAKVQNVPRLCVSQHDDGIVELRNDGNRIQNSRPLGLSQSAVGSSIVRTLVRCHESI
jgi:hypothetical protein